MQIYNPHIGWRTINENVNTKENSSWCAKLPNGEIVYFINDTELDAKFGELPIGSKIYKKHLHKSIGLIPGGTDWSFQFLKKNHD